MNHAKLLGESFKALGEIRELTAKTGVGLTIIEKQLILYTKGHFTDLGKMDYAEDLKYFAAEAYGLYPKQVEQRSIFHMVITLYQKLIDNGYIRFDLEQYMANLFKRSWLHDNDGNKISRENVLDQMLAEIQGCPVKGMDLDKADLSIFYSV